MSHGARSPRGLPAQVCCHPGPPWELVRAMAAVRLSQGSSRFWCGDLSCPISGASCRSCVCSGVSQASKMNPAYQQLSPCTCAVFLCPCIGGLHEIHPLQPPPQHTRAGTVHTTAPRKLSVTLSFSVWRPAFRDGSGGAQVTGRWAAFLRPGGRVALPSALRVGLSLCLL